MKSMLASLIIGVLGISQSAASADQALGVKPLVAVDEIKGLAAQCGVHAEIEVIPGGVPELLTEDEPDFIDVTVERDSSQVSIQCFNKGLPNIRVEMRGGTLTPDILDEIKSRCKWQQSDGLIEQHSNGELQFQPDPMADYDKVGCMLNGVRPYVVKFGFVGNEAYSAEENEKQK